MAALTGLSTKVFIKNGDKTLSSSRFAQLGRSDIAFSVSPSFKKLHFDHFVLPARWIAKSHTAPGAEVLTSFEAVMPGIQNIQPSKTVQVKFQLQKMCRFGEQFLLVGDNPMLGLWNPSCAIPMNWSDGNMWCVELDMPIDSTIQFKFMLKRDSGEVLWQPGPDRILKTWENNNTLVVTEDWENAEAQKITEEQLVNQLDDQREELMANPNNAAMFSDSMAFAEAKPKPNMNYELVTRTGINHPVDGHMINAHNEMKSDEYVAIRKEEGMQNSNPRTINGMNLVTMEEEATLFSFKEGSVRVPGLSPRQVGSTEGESSTGLESFIGDTSSIGVDSAKD